jgi:hypothetical protein
MLAAILAVVVVAVVKFPNFAYNFGSTGNWGFGPDWECSYPGKGDPVCVKKPAPSR